MGKRGRSRYSARLVAQALRESRGFVNLASEFLGCSRATIYKYIQRYPAVKRALREARRETREAVERKLYERAMAGDIGAIVFLLKRMGSWNINRGGERDESVGEETNGEGAAHTLP